MKRSLLVLISGIALPIAMAGTESADGNESNGRKPATARQETSEAAAKFEEARALLPKGPKRGNPERSFALMMEAAEAGYPDAVGAIGHYLANGIGTPGDEVEAVRWFRRGAELGSAKAMLNYGLVLCQGKGTTADPESGREWIRKAAATGLPEANLEWAEALFHGNHGVTVDQAAAFPFYKVAADAGHPGACNTLGTMYEFGTGVLADPGIATELYQKAAARGHTLGQVNYSRMLDPESNDTGRRVEAIAWLLLAEESGSVQAGKLLQPLRIGGAAGDFGAAATRAGKLRMEILRGRADRP
jgi:TPR repeat protein